MRSDPHSLPLFDAKLGRARKRAGMADALEGAGPEWTSEAYNAIRDVAKAKASFTSDDVWATGLTKPKNARALGPVMRQAERDGLIKASTEFVLTKQATRNRAPIRVWNSLTFAGDS